MQNEEQSSRLKQPSEDEVERVARIIAYETGDTMGDHEPVFWSGYDHKDSARKAARKVIAALREQSYSSGEGSSGN
jgi:hypothetical protein